ncbi:uncharacterized protein LOC119263847 isoform X1 [Pygocentrus nattereri]|uniref:uncharacterized protein LOC119263847 isoform X1 n=1 Tax=Pygocentrus nattereri TaxID=42514 RepID=UPI001890D83D|nr:uncharacterized protein LOC119263847 isoform X1 [Pygocentrus nattereri]XP_037396308.1 uncharacterized protein LOC119263847 isoform X1 [Pygocentrus nattereri]XP_037396309.1 uncharacterized protein LOC119263847 isoform X1 [Pygocentrus nattereri]
MDSEGDSGNKFHKLLQEAQRLAAELNPKLAKKRRSAKPVSGVVSWRQRDNSGQIIPKFPPKTYNSTTRKRSSSEVAEPVFQQPEPTPYDSAQELNALQDILRDIPPQEKGTVPLSWAERQAQSSEKWNASRSAMVKNIFLAEHTDTYICDICLQNTSVVRCRDCLPRQFLCSSCDTQIHQHILHNREAMFEGFYQPLAPNMIIQLQNDGSHQIKHEVRLLPVRLPQQCTCSPSQLKLTCGNEVILVGINGRYQLNLPTLSCSQCMKSWTTGLDELVQCGYWPATINHQTIFHVDLFQSFQDLKQLAPGLSRQAFIGMLDERTKYFGRTGKICGDTFQRSILEWCYAQHEVDKLLEVEPFRCTACSPQMHAVSVDGNRKLYRFKNASGSATKGLFDGTFLARDEEVSSFVAQIQQATKHVNTPGKGMCGSSQWTAAKEHSGKSASKIDEEGLEIAVCRHGVLLRALNMFRGEIYAYPLYLQKELSPSNVSFFCSDVACKYYPYLEKVSNKCSELQGLLEMHPLLSVMHAKAHSWTCELKWGGCNQEGAGNTIGEEVEQVNSFLSRAAISTKYMSKGGRTDMLTVLAMGWNKKKMSNMDKILAQSYAKAVQRVADDKLKLEELKAELRIDDAVIQQWVTEVQHWPEANSSLEGEASREVILKKKIEGLYLSVMQRKHRLYRQTDSNKRRHKLRQKIAEEKAALSSAIEELREQTDIILPAVDELLLTENFVWSWTYLGPTDLRTKKAIFDQVMVIRRMQEEEQIVVQEMRRHLNSLIGVAGSLKTLLLDQSNGAHCGYHSMLRRRLSVVNAQVHHTKASFSLALHGEMTSQDMLSEDREEQVSDVEDTSDDDNDIDSS